MQTFYRNYDAALGRFVSSDPMPESAESMTGYNYAGNNPVLYNDPIGDQKKDLFEMPKEIDNSALWGSGGGYYKIKNKWADDMAKIDADWSLLQAAKDGDPDATAQYVAQNGQAVQREAWNGFLVAAGFTVVLHVGGELVRVKQDAEGNNIYNFANSGNVWVNTLAGIKVDPASSANQGGNVNSYGYKGPDAEIQSLSAAFAFGGGYSFEIGVIHDDHTGERRFFFSHGPTIGINLSIGINIEEIRVKDGHHFTLDTYPGYSSGYSGGLAFFGVERSGDRDANYQSTDWGWFGNTYNQSGFSLSAGGKVGAMWSRTHTSFLGQ